MRNISFGDIHSRLVPKVGRVYPAAIETRLYGRLDGVVFDPGLQYRFMRDRRSGTGKHHWFIAACSEWSPEHLRVLKDAICVHGIAGVTQVEVGNTVITCYQPTDLQLVPVVAPNATGFYIRRDKGRSKEKLAIDDLHTDCFIYTC